MLIARLQEQMLDEQADVAEQAVSHQILVRLRGLQGRDCKRLARTTAFELGRRRRVLALVQAEQAAVMLSSVDVHRALGPFFAHRLIDTASRQAETTVPD